MDIAKARQMEQRSHLMKALDRARPDVAPESLLLRSLKQSSLALERDALLKELDYLEAKGIVAHSNVLWWLTPLGIDVLEHSVEAPPGIPQNGTYSPQELLRRKELRVRVLVALWYGRPEFTPHGVVWGAVSDADMIVTGNEVVREALYLQGKALIELSGDPKNDWAAKLTATGLDVLDRNIDAPVGIDLIEQYWGG